ncbi:MAG: hypothetical protein HYW34_00605 [Candidatus Brennerbacteria bacterium]|nr:hypothetical protein [Candidatus Brennerbacteria bacterium]
MGEILDFEKFKKEKEVDIARQEEDKKIIERLEQREKERVSADIKISSISGFKEHGAGRVGPLGQP